MLRRFCVALFVVCFTLCMSPLAFAAEDSSAFGDRELVKIREGVYEYVAPDGSIQKTYIGIAGLEDRLAGLRRELDFMTAAGPFGVDQLKKMALLSKEIHVLESFVEASLAEAVGGDPYSKILSDCDQSTSSVNADGEPYGAAVKILGEAEFSAYGTCTAYGAVFAYYWDEGTGTDTDSENSGGYVSSLDIEAAVYGGHDGAYCEYSSAALYFNLGGVEYASHEYPEDCYCPNCS